MPKKFVKRSKPTGKPGGQGKGAKGAGRPTKKGPKGPPNKRVFRKRPPRPGSQPADTGPREDGERLQKVLAAAGIASRRDCEELILEGRVLIDGEVVSELGARVDLDKQTVHVDGEALAKPKLVYFAVNKPTGVVCTARDPSGRPRVTDLLPPSVGRVFAVGRLDMSSEGLILLTNDGDLANRLTHPRHGVEKLYHVQVAGKPTAEALSEVRKGVYLDEGRVAFANIKVKSTKKSSAILEVILDEGRNREIRRVLARVGHKVQKLERIAVGPVRLGEMPSGAYRPLTREEITALVEATQPKAKAAKAKPPKRKPAASKPSASKSVAEDKRTAGPRPNRKRPPHKDGAPPKVESSRRIIGDVAEEKPPAKARPVEKADPERAPKRIRRKPAGPGNRSGGDSRGGKGKPSGSGKRIGSGKPAVKKHRGGGKPKGKP
ncbi:Ribosomal large subunit pseudouridine synthase B [Botrimarina colliarenosi]|uniref:Pseudouridine synthase n=1 Tax=Botrimarina colliarenosi TaxID=2528001 RepID=A0A5C6AJ74_9BACT|nr:pseudouridine synthase [Botrimarina colliarenosi]TWT99679.1 Ribosomal large subunit pseudouridine synthase B [Botrimarina colliarenosi]